MIRSCHYARQEMPDVQCILYGSLQVDPEYVTKCQNLVDKLNLQGNFTFGGFHNTPGMIFNEGDISILSSISEGFPYTVIESMSCGRPVVSTDVGGIREALEGCGELCIKNIYEWYPLFYSCKSFYQRVGSGISLSGFTGKPQSFVWY